MNIFLAYACQIDSALQGVFIKQPDDTSSALTLNGIDEQLSYDKVIGYLPINFENDSITPLDLIYFCP